MSAYSVVAIVLVSALVLWSVAAYVAVRNLEEPKYVLIEKKNGYEIRSYESYIVATTKVTGTYRESMNDGFRAIAGYIFGGNAKKESIAMTAPVQESTSEQIVMTVPVLEKESEKERFISFTMPRNYTLATLPKPNNPAVLLEEVPARTVAVMRFSWWASAKRIEQKKQELLALLSRDGVAAAGPVEAAYYNPPLHATLYVAS